MRIETRVFAFFLIVLAAMVAGCFFQLDKSNTHTIEDVTSEVTDRCITLRREYVCIEGVNYQF